MLPVVDRSLIVFFSGMILSYLESQGITSLSEHNQNTQIVQTVIGGLLGAVTIISFYVHHTAVQKNQTPSTETAKPFFLFPLLASLKKFIISQKQEKTIISEEVVSEQIAA